MALNIGLVDYQKTIPVAEMAEHRRVGIMTGADRIKIVPLHQHQILFHLFHADRAARDRIRIMAVDSVKFYFLTV